eukprot:TRINITY_DN18219_c0_g1_i7.p2 TRINITY_DN18219_c0_g1~~TRINITY_DN18219_c0_g1_i7.p2  ORF type:complete len:186 (-),score=45.03 TRINITY_DN18219_c0_g1_i7:217-774(-)
MKHHIGMVWENLDRLKKLKLNNRFHITAQLHVTLGQVKDARRELREEINSHVSQEAASSEGNAQTVILEQTLCLINTTVDLANRLAIACVVKQPEPESKESLTLMEGTIALVDRLAMAVDDLVISVDLPPDTEEVAEAIEALSESVQAILERVGQSKVDINDLDVLTTTLGQHKVQILESLTLLN